MPAPRVVPAFDEIEDGEAGVGRRPEAVSIQQLTLEGREEALAHGVVVGVAHTAHRRPDAVRAAGSKVELFHAYALVATHRRARPGQRRTLVAHLPPEKVHFLLQTPAWCRERAAAIGPACGLFIEGLLGDRPLDRLRGAQGVLRLADRYGAARVDATCARAHAVGEHRYHTIKAILDHALDRQPLPGLAPLAPSPDVPRHARPWTTFFPDPKSEDRRSPAWT